MRNNRQARSIPEALLNKYNTVLFIEVCCKANSITQCDSCWEQTNVIITVLFLIPMHSHPRLIVRHHRIWINCLCRQLSGNHHDKPPAENGHHGFHGQHQQGGGGGGGGGWGGGGYGRRPHPSHMMDR